MSEQIKKSVLAVRTGAHFKTLKDESEYQQCLYVPEIYQPDIYWELKPPFDKQQEAQKQWEKIIDETRHAVSQLRDSSPDVVDVYFEGPHPLALFLGRELATRCRSQALNVHQWQPRTQRFESFLCPSVLKTGQENRGPSYFKVLTKVDEVSSGSGIVLALECVQGISKDQLIDLAERTGSGEIYKLEPLSNQREQRFLTDPVQKMAALQQAKNAIAQLSSKHRHATLHVVSTLPVAFLILLGNRLPKSVFNRIICHDTANIASPYQSILNVMNGDVSLDITRRRLEIIEDDGMIFYNLDGTYLPAARPAVSAHPLEGSPCRQYFCISHDAIPNIPKSSRFLWGLNRETEDRAKFYKRAKQHNRYLMPPSVAAELRKIDEKSSFDIEIKLKGDSSLLDWTYLADPQADNLNFMALNPGWSIHYTLPKPPGGRLKPIPVKDLKILMIASMQDSDDVFHEVNFPELKARIEAHGAQVQALGPDVSIEEIEGTLEAFQPHIIHWLGHGHADSKGKWDIVAQAFSHTLPGNHIDRERLIRLLTEHKPRLIVFCSCSIGSPAKGYGVPHHLLDSGVRAVLGFRSRVLPAEVNPFFNTFYTELLGGAPLRQATQKARMSLQLMKWPASFGLATLSVQDRGALEEIVYAKPVIKEETTMNPATHELMDEMEQVTPNSTDDPGHDTAKKEGGIGTHSGDSNDDGDGRHAKTPVKVASVEIEPRDGVWAIQSPVEPSSEKKEGGIGTHSGDSNDDGDGRHAKDPNIDSDSENGPTRPGKWVVDVQVGDDVSRKEGGIGTHSGDSNDDGDGRYAQEEDSELESEDGPTRPGHWVVDIQVDDDTSRKKGGIGTHSGDSNDDGDGATGGGSGGSGG